MADRTKRMWALMGRIKSASRKATRLTVAMGYLCLLLPAVNVSGDALHGKPSAQHASQKLDHADLLGLLDCATRPDQLLAVRPEFYGSDNFRVRYVFPVRPGHEANLLNMMHPTNGVTLVLYHRDARHAALFEVGFDRPPSKKRTFFLLDGGNLEKEGTRWVVKDILNGGASTWPEIVDHVDRVSTASLVTIPRGAVTRTNAACDFPTPGQTFSAVSASGDQSNWKFKDGASEGIPLKTHSGPFNNSDLKRGPSRQVYINTYGP
jgi:hypothetical protein